MNKQTAVEQLEEYLSISLGPHRMRMLFNEFEKAKQLEQDQHLEKWQEGWNEAFDFVQHFKQQGVTIITKKNE